jgi:hypothetical protein
MANLYKIAAGHDNAGSLSALSFPVTSPQGIQYPEYVTATDGTVIPKGLPFCTTVMPELTDTQYAELFTKSGMGTGADDTTAEVTVSLPTNDRTAAFANYNALMIHRKGVDANYQDRHWRDVRVTYAALEAL